MPQVIIILAALALILALVLMARRKPDPPPTARSRNRIRRLAMQSRPAGMIRLRPQRRLISLLRRAIRLPAALPAAELLTRHQHELMQLHLDVRQSLRGAPRLPRDQQGEARMMRLCMVLLEQEDAVTSETLLRGLTTWQDASHTTLHERDLLPTCMRLTLTQLLTDTLHAMLRRDSTPDQDLLTQRIHSILDTARALKQSDWFSLSEPEDPLHRLLLQDPSGVYPRMTPVSRRMYRQEVAYWASAFHADEAALAQACIDLAASVPQDDIRANAGWHLLEHEGRMALRRHLHTQRGLIRLLLHGCPLAVSRIAHAAGLIAASMIYLHSGYPLWSLPLLLGAISPLTSPAAQRLYAWLRRERLPALAIAKITDQERTLILLPVVLRDADHAAQMVRCLQVAREACPDGAVDCLLAGDFTEHPTPVGTADSEIIAAADAAVRAASTPSRPFYYMQRSRVWDERRRVFAGRAGLRGAREAVDRLICDGACDDAFDHVTLDPAQLYRRYACILLLRPDVRLSPDSLPSLIGMLFHPLNHRHGLIQPCMKVDLMRSKTRASRLIRNDRLTGLYRPEAMLSDVHSVLPAHDLGHPLLEAELVGRVFAGVGFAAGASTTERLIRRMRKSAVETVELLRWLWPWASKPDGVQRNPLPSAGLSALRQAVFRWISPLCTAGLLLFGALARSEPLVLIAVFAPLLPELHQPQGFSHWLVGLTLLPQRCFAVVDGLMDAALRRFSRTTAQAGWFPGASDADGFAQESIAQGVGVVALLGVSLVPWPPCVAGCAVTALWASMPLLPRWLDVHTDHRAAYTEEDAAALLDVARATWRYFADHTADLPPESVQEEPPLGPSRTSSAAGIALYLLACVAAIELELIDASDFANRVSSLTAALDSLPMWHGLPYDRYSLRTRAPAPAAVIRSTDCGWLFAALLTSARAVQAHHGDPALSIRLNALADRMSLECLYDASAGLLFTEIDPETGESLGGHHELLASEALLASFACMMRRATPANHMTHLNRTLAGRVLFSPTGGLADYLLPTLLLPYGNETQLDASARSAINAHKRTAVTGVYGMSDCCYMDFDRRSRYRRGSFGLPSLAWEPQPAETVIAPYASALALPYDASAFGNLTRLRALSMLGRCGFFDSLDCCPSHLPEGESRALVRCWTAAHQGATLCAICNALTGGALQRYFTDNPAVEAWLPVLCEPASSHPSLPK